ncbi:polyprenyl diphosphate synthase [Marinicella meishanensis]|uniref:polyprenyl diphosphate synthase n=1 Tax=Marinicella meishanensis TaxID=2873263 RepID=UPI001CC1B788|nr:polyprenyl diphosphate synthase [Marinicella sp. NBU2979]
MSIQHIAIIMDGNGRWATQRKRPRTFGHQAGVKTVRSTIETCVQLGIPSLTLFAFSSENWSRPAKEVQRLMDLFMRSLNKETPELLAQGVQQNFIGDLTQFSDKLQRKMHEVASLKPSQHRMNLNIAVNYGGKWDVLQAARKMAQEVSQQGLDPTTVTEQQFQSHLSLADQPAVDLLIRTGGEHRISNFLLWQIAYAEVFFVDTLWPDFDADALLKVVDAFNLRERRFGQTSEQVNA